MRPGVHKDVPLAPYLNLDAIGSTQLGWLAVSPLYYRYMRGQRPKPTDATELGVAVHCAVLEPESFVRRYSVEPELELVAPGASKPRATKAYRDAVEEIESDGYQVLKEDVMRAVQGMARSVLAHPHAAAVLQKAPEREVTAIWERGRGAPDLTLPCRGRLDALGDRVAADLKTTRSLRNFSPWTISQRRYHSQASWYCDGLARLGRPVDTYFLVAVESSPPHDVGVFVVDRHVLEAGQASNDALVERLFECEASGNWPGMYPSIESAEITMAAAEMAEE